MEYLLKSTFVLSLFYFFYILFLQKDTFFQSIRFYFITGIVASLTIPIIVIKKYVLIDPVIISGANITVGQINTIPESTFSWSQIIWLSYFAGVLFFTVKFLIQLSSLMWFLYENPKTKKGDFTFVEIQKDITPFSFFNYIAINKNQFQETELTQIIAHEKTHATQYHSIDILLIQLFAIFHWFNPFVWLYTKEIQKNLEFIADGHALGTASDNKDYHHLLLKTISPNYQMTLTTNFYNSLIKKRIDMLQKNRSSKTMQIKFLLVIPMLIAFVFTFNTKVIAQKKDEWKIEIKTDRVDYFEVITKDTKNHELEKMKENFAKSGTKFKFKKLKRNNKDEITGISITVKNKAGNEAKLSQQSDKPISAIKINDNLTTGELSIGNVSEMDNTQNVFFSSGSDGTHQTYVVKSDKKGDKNMTWVTADDTKLSLVEESNGVVIVTDEDGEHKTITVTVDENKDIQFGDSGKKNVSVWVSDENDTSTLSMGEDKKKSYTYTIKRVGGEDDIHVGHDVGSESSKNFIFISDGKTKGDSTKLGEIKIIKLHEDGDEPHKMIIKTDKSSNGNTFIFKTDSDDKIDASNTKKIIFRSTSNKTPLFILDGKEMKEGKIDDISPDTIQSMNVLKGEKAIEKYGEKGKDGVIEITTKK